VRVSKATGTVIPKPKVASELRPPRSSVVGPKDTAEDDVFAVSYMGYDKHMKAIYKNLPNADKKAELVE